MGRPETQFAETRKEARRFLDELYRESYLPGLPVATDTEFVPVTHEPVLMSYSWGRGIRRVVRAELVKDVFGDWLTDPDTKLFYQSYKEDAETFDKLGIPEVDLRNSFYGDVLVMAVLRDETLLKHGLKEQCLHWLKWFRRGYAQLFCYVPPGKKKPIVMDPRQVMDNLPEHALVGAVLKWGNAKGGHEVGERSARRWRRIMVDYAGDDAEGTQVLGVDHVRYLKKVGYWDSYKAIDREFTLTLIECENHGALVDQPILKKILRKQIIRMIRASRCFRTAAGNDKLNLNSDQQMRKLLIDEWGWPTHPELMTDGGKTGNKQPSLNREALTWWKDEHELEMAEVILAFNNANTLRGTFLQGLLDGVSEDGRLRSDLNQVGAKASGRISSRKFEVLKEKKKFLKSGEVRIQIVKKKAGANLQNIPARKEKDPDGIRGAFRAPLIGEMTAWGDVASEDHHLLIADYAGFHLMLVIHWVSKLTKKSSMLEIMKKFGTPSAVHVNTTIEMFKHKEHRCSPDSPVCFDSKVKQWKKFHEDNKSFALREFEMERDWKMVKSIFPDQYTYSKNCVTGETMILTEHGYRRIDELCAGAPLGRSKPTTPIRIVTRDGIREVADIYRGGRQPVKKLTTELGFAVRANDSHDMPVVRDGKIEMVKVGDMKVGDICVMKLGSGIHGSSVDIPQMEQSGKTCYKPINLPTKLTSEIARLLGYYVAEGYSLKSNTTYNTSFGFGPDDRDMVLDVEHCLRSVVGSRLKVREGTDGNFKTKWRFDVTSKDLYEWWRHLGCGELAAGKQIPPCVLSAPWVTKREFLRAYFAGDGSITKNGVITITSKSEQLIRQVQGELINVGIACHVLRDERDLYGTYWRLQVSNRAHVLRFATLIGFSCNRKQQIADSLEPKGEHSLLMLDGFERDLATIVERTDGKIRSRVAQCLRGACRFGEHVVRKLDDDALAGTEIEKMLDDGLWTVPVTSIKPDGEEEVFDLYEPVHKMMLASGLLVGDTNFALIFLGSPWTLAYNTGRDPRDEDQLDECKRLYDEWYEMYPEISLYQNHMIDHGYDKGWVPTIGGRRLHVRKMLDGCDKAGRYIKDEDKRKKMIKHGERVCTNDPAQGSEADIVKMALNKLRQSDRLRELRCAPLFPVHDEVVSEGPISMCDEALALKIKLMQEPYRDIMDFVLTVEGAHGPTWQSAKP